MTSPVGDFERRLAATQELTKHWNLFQAFSAARNLLRDFPQEARAHTLFHLLVCLTDNEGGQNGGMRYKSPQLIDNAIRIVPGFKNSVAHGDMLRDRLLGLVRFHDKAHDSLVVARDLPTQIENLHRGDGNRLACLTDAKARLYEAEGDPLAAYDTHKLAHQDWMGLPEGEADPNWVHFNLVHWLRTSIALWGRNAPHTKEIMTLLAAETERAPGAHGKGQIRVIRTPIIGLRVYRWLETHRMS